MFQPPASRGSREQFFEHLRVEMSDLRGGIETEDLWQAIDSLEATEPLKHLAEAGLRIKLPAVGAFLLGRPRTATRMRCARAISSQQVSGAAARQRVAGRDASSAAARKRAGIRRNRR
jgi:hypothetical protein